MYLISSPSAEPSIKTALMDLINTDEKADAESCDHFSIRGYVSEIRKRDRRMCWPFASSGNEYDEQSCGLPSLHVPKFRYWQCKKCLCEIGAKVVGNDYGPILKFCTDGSKPNSICCNALAIDVHAMLLSDSQQVPELDTFKDQKVGGDDSATFREVSGDYPIPYSDDNEKKSEGAHGLIRAKNLENGNKMNEDLHIPREKTYQKDGNEDLKSKHNGSTDLCKPGCEHHDVADADIAKNLNCMAKNASKTNGIGEAIPMVDQQESAAGDASGEGGNLVEAFGADKGSGLPSVELDECDYDSSESAEIIAANNARDPDTVSGLHRRKTRKVRLLTELLCKGVKDTHNNRNDGSLSNGVPDASNECDKLVHQGKLALQGNHRTGSGQQRKRKSDGDEEWRPLQTISPNKGCKEGRVSRRELDPTDAIGRALARMQLQTGGKNHHIKRRIDKSLSVDKKKKKKLDFDESSSLVAAQENVPTEIRKKTEDACNSNAAGLLVRATTDAVTTGEADIFLLSAQRMDKKSSSKKKRKMPQVDEQASVIPQNHGLLKEIPMSMKDVKSLHARPLRVPFHNAQEASSEVGLNLSLNSYVNTQRYDMMHNLQLEDEQACLLTWKEGTSGDDQVNRKSSEIKNLGNCNNFNLASASASDKAFGKELYSDISGKRSSIAIPWLNEKQNYTSQFGIDGRSHMHQKKFFSSSSKKPIAVQECLTVSRKEHDQRSNKAAEKVTSDDIPMEIVELMAKHQYERCLPDADYNRCQIELNDNPKTSWIMDFDKAYGNGEMSLCQQDTPDKRNALAISGRSVIPKNGENVKSAKQKSVDYFSQSDLNQYNFSQLKHSPAASRFGAFLQHQEKPLNGIQNFPSTSGRQISAQNYGWIGDLVGKKSSCNSLQTSGTCKCNTCQSIPLLSEETSHLWSSVMPNHMPLACSLAQKCSALPTGLDVLSNSPNFMNKENTNGLLDLKFLNQNATSYGKQNWTFGSDVPRTCADPFACKHNKVGLTQKPTAPFDLYSKETIPAMHLLSLMDARLQSSSPINPDVAPKFLKRSSVTSDQVCKEVSRLDSGAYKVTNTMKHSPYDSRCKNHVVVDPQGCTSTTPVLVVPSTSSLSHDKTFKNATDFTCQVSQDKGKGKASDTQPPSGGFQSQKSASPSLNFGINCSSVPVHSMQTMLFGASGSMAFPLPFQGLENPSKHKLKVHSGIRPSQPHKSSSDGICCVNRNPADFSIPGPGNSYMISGKELKVGKKGPLVNGCGSTSTRLVMQKRLKKVS